ncbi:MAG: mandelate racemase/muconate lactonizing enzyme family protein [Acetobacteraceae bacterium]|nr:mandelate racemase/muconate lactonizing enzyme family protein [Acetobacteraceae bacterium]
MKIAAARVYLVRSGRFHPVLLELLTDDGTAGIGEAAIAYGHGGTAAAGMLKDLCEALVLGRDPFRIEELWSDLYDHSFWAKGGGPIVFAAISAIDQALHDIKGKALGVPAFELLGGRFRDEVRVYANGWCSGKATPDAFASAGMRPVGEGYDALKCYPLGVRDAAGSMRHVSRRTLDAAALDLAFEKVAALRRAVGPKVEIMLDMSGGVTTDESIRLCRRWEPLDILFVEEPVDPFDATAMRRVSEAVAMPVAAGERHYTRHGFRKLFDHQAVGIVQPDVGNTGGLLEAKKIAAMAEAYTMRVAPHNCGSSLLTAASLQLAAAIPNFMIQEIYPYFPEDPGYVQVLENPPERSVRQGRMAIPDGPGLGVRLDRTAVAPFLWAECLPAS